MTQPPPDDPFAPPGQPPVDPWYLRDQPQQQPWAQPPPPPAWGQPSWVEPAYPYRPGPPTGAVAITAFVLSFFCFPVAIVLGIIALVQAHRGRYGGRGFAIAALAISGAWIVVISLVVLAGVNGAFDDTSYSVSDTKATAVGQCADTSGFASHLVACTSLHDQEVFWVQHMELDGFPGTDKLDADADALCRGHFQEYVGTAYDASDLDYDWYAPSRSEWSAGERRVICVLLTDGWMTSARGSRR